MSKSDEIKFFHPQGAYGYLSNFSEHSVELDGICWLTAEHAYQAKKFHTGSDWRERIRTAPTADLAKRLTRDPGAPVRTDWETRKVDVMRRVIEAKFVQHADLAGRLVATGQRVLVEHSRDGFWGDGEDGSGSNQLGELLMALREKLTRTLH
jgi:ribA/ribD-fused uncharacterized protein